MVGYRNLGDEVIWHATKNAFLPLRLSLNQRPSKWFIRRLFQDLGQRDLAILGGGTLIGDNLRDGTNPFREDFAELAQRCRKSVAFGTGVGVLLPDASRNAWLKEWQPILSRCSYIGVRGPDSVESLRYIDIKAEMLGDAACLVAKEPGFWQPRKKLLGLNVGMTPGRPEMPMDQYVKIMSEVIKSRINEGWKVEILLVLPDDEAIAQQVVQAVGSPDLSVHSFYLDGEQYLQHVRKMQAFIGIKLHSVVLAMCAGVPSIMIEYAPKCRDFMKSMDVERFTTYLGSISPDSIQVLFDSLLSEGDKLGQDVASQMNLTRKRLLQRAADVRSMSM